MRSVKDDAISRFAHPIERAHVGYEIVVAKRRAALGKTELRVAKGDQFFGDVSHVPRRQELTLFHIDRATCFCGSAQQIRLPAEKRRDLQHIDAFAGDLRFLRGMNVSCHWHFQVASDRRKNLAAFAYADSAK